MKIVVNHPWNVGYRGAIRIQEELRSRLFIKNTHNPIRYVAGADAYYDKEKGYVYGAVVVLSFPELILKESAFSKIKISFPYIPGLLSFREGPSLIKAFKRLSIEPDLIILNGQGIAHPRNMGLATHIGIIFDKPSIGCASSKLVGEYNEPENEKGCWKPLRYNSKTIGAVLRTRENVKPIFISPGHRISLKHTVSLTLKLCKGYRMPQPIRLAHTISRNHSYSKHPKH